MKDFKQIVIDDNFEWLKHNENKMVGDTLSFFHDNKEIEIKRINGIWNLNE